MYELWKFQRVEISAWPSPVTSFLKMYAQYTNPRLHRRKAKFTPEEDAALTAVINKLGTADWELIADHMPNRNPRQCRDRWYYILSPDVSKAPWTADEDAKLLQLYRQLGPKWVQIANMFPGRIDTHIKNRWLVLQRRFRRYGTYEPLENIKMPVIAGLASLEQGQLPSPADPTPQVSVPQSPVEQQVPSPPVQPVDTPTENWEADALCDLWTEALFEEWNLWELQ